MARPVRGFAEETIHTGWKHVTPWAQRPGVSKWVKRESNQRLRREARDMIREQRQ